MMWTLLSIFVIARLGARAFDSHFFGNLIWHIDLANARTMSEHSGVTGKTPHQVARAAPEDSRGGPINYSDVD